MEISIPRRILYSLWLVPLVPVALIAAVSLLNLLYGFGAGAVVGTLSLFGVLVPLAYLLGWLTSHERVERLAFLVSLAAYGLLLTASILASALRVSRYGLTYTVLAILWGMGIIAALVLALRRRAAVVVRAALHRTPEQRAARRDARERVGERRRQARVLRSQRRRRHEDELVADERAKMSRRSRCATGAPASVGARGLDVDLPGDGATREPGRVLGEVLGVHGDEPETEPAPPAQHEPVVAAPTTKEPTPAATPQTTLDVNACTATDLLPLPGMSAALARAIVAEREDGGPYASVEQLVARNHLKPHVVAPFLARLTVTATADAPGPARRARMLDL